MIDVAVLGGGPSVERAISLQSAAGVSRALDPGRFRVTRMRVETDGRIVVGSAEQDPFSDAAALGPEVGSAAIPAIEAGRALCDWREACDARGDSEALVVFPALHGTYGEDGTVQGLLRALRLPFVGSGVAASALALDKVTSREFLRGLGMPVAPAVLSFPPHDADAIELEVSRRLGFPAFAKLDTSGSSLGVERVDSPSALREFVRAAGLHRLVIEAALRGREVSVPVLGNRGEDLRALTPVGIEPRGREFFDHVAKYQPEACTELVPPPGMSEGSIASVQKLALEAHRLLGCDGVSRSDFIVTEDGPVFLETNTIPGLTAQSLLPKCAAHDGMDFSALCAHLVELALRVPGVGAGIGGLTDSRSEGVGS